MEEIENERDLEYFKELKLVLDRKYENLDDANYSGASFFMKEFYRDLQNNKNKIIKTENKLNDFTIFFDSDNEEEENKDVVKSAVLNSKKKKKKKIFNFANSFKLPTFDKEIQVNFYFSKKKIMKKK